MTEPAASRSEWVERAAARSPSLRRSHARSIQQAQTLVDAARRLISTRGEHFTTQDLVKEAGVALQTFYRYFAGKDELLLAVIESLIADACTGYQQQAEGIDDPVHRLRSYLTAVMASLDTTDDNEPSARFIASEHWRLSQLFPEAVTLATKPFTDMIAASIAAGTQRGVFRSPEPERDAWLITQFVLSVFHQQTFAPTKDPGIADDLIRLCLTALGSTEGASGPEGRRDPGEQG